MIELHRGDCLGLLPSLAGRFHAVVFDPPYGIGYVHSGCGQGLHRRRNVRPISGDDGPFDPAPWLSFPCLLWGSDHYRRSLPDGGSWLAWDKSVGKGPADRFVDCEFAWCSRPGVKRNAFRHLWKGICSVKEGEHNGRGQVIRHHPSMKPVALMRWSIECLGLPPGSTILDPYMGSGTTGIAAVQLGFHFIGIEVDPEYFAVAEARIAAASLLAA